MNLWSPCSSLALTSASQMDITHHEDSIQASPHLFSLGRGLHFPQQRQIQQNHSGYLCIYPHPPRLFKWEVHTLPCPLVTPCAIVAQF